MSALLTSISAFWHEQLQLALQPYQIATLIGVQVIIIIVYAQFLVHEKYPKDPDIFPYPGAGEVNAWLGLDFSFEWLGPHPSISWRRCLWGGA